MIHLTHPWFLLLLLVVPLVLWRWSRRARPALRYPDTGLLAGLPTGRSRFVQRVGLGVRTIVLVSLVFALSGPRVPGGPPIATEGIAIMMLVDVSGSMAETDFDWQGQPMARIDAVKRAFTLFVAGGDVPGGEQLEGRPSDLVGLIAFATRPDTICPLTLSHSVLQKELEALKPRTLLEGPETNISDAIALGLDRLLTARPKRRVMVLLTDGEHNVSPT